MAPDAVRQGVFVQLLMSLEDSERDASAATGGFLGAYADRHRFNY